MYKWNAKKPGDKSSSLQDETISGFLPNQLSGPSVVLRDTIPVNTKPYCLSYLCASEGFHPPVLDAGSSFADVHGVVEECLVFEGELLRPVPDRREIHSLVFPLRDGFVPGKVLHSNNNE